MPRLLTSQARSYILPLKARLYHTASTKCALYARDKKKYILVVLGAYEVVTCLRRVLFPASPRDEATVKATQLRL
ncbi:hypothetical protein MY3296_007615 [Beauveria thailandica]